MIVVAVDVSFVDVFMVGTPSAVHRAG